MKGGNKDLGMCLTNSHYTIEASYVNIIIKDSYFVCLGREKLWYFQISKIITVFIKMEIIILTQKGHIH